MKRFVLSGYLTLFSFLYIFPVGLFFLHAKLSAEKEKMARRLSAIQRQDVVIANFIFRWFDGKMPARFPPERKPRSFRVIFYSPLGIAKNSSFPAIPAPLRSPLPSRWVPLEGKLWRETLFSLSPESPKIRETPFLGIAVAASPALVKPQDSSIEMAWTRSAPRGIGKLLTQVIPLQEKIAGGSPLNLLLRYPLTFGFFFRLLFLSWMAALLLLQVLQPKRRRPSKREVQLEEELLYLSKTYQDLAKSLRLEREKVESILNSAPDGIFTCHSDGRILYWNRSMESLTGVPQENTRDKYYSQVLTLFSPSGQLLVDPFSPCLTSGKNLNWLDCRMEIAPALFPLPASRSFPVAVGAAPIRRSDDSIEEIVVTVKDIRKQKEAEQMKKELHAMITHDLRSPLSAILGYAGLIQNSGMWHGESERQKYLDSLVRAGKGMLVLIGNLLGWAGVEGGKLPVKKEIFSIKSVMEEVVENLGILGKPKNLIFSVEAEENITLRSDPDRLKEILLNLLSNAIKFSRFGGIVKLSAKEQGNEIAVSVSDSGPGISAEERKKLFEKFSGIRRKGSGTGLGLYIVKALTQALEGRIEIESQENRGSTFTLFLALERKLPSPHPQQLSLTALNELYSVQNPTSVIPASAGIQDQKNQEEFLAARS